MTILDIISAILLSFKFMGYNDMSIWRCLAPFIASSFIYLSRAFAIAITNNNQENNK